MPDDDWLSDVARLFFLGRQQIVLGCALFSAPNIDRAKP